MAGIPIPQNQLNALPLLSVQDATAGGTLDIIGGTLNKQWTDTMLGISGTAPSGPDAFGQYTLATPYLDFRGCKQFLMAVTLSNPAASGGNITIPLKWFLQHRNGPGDAPAIGDLGQSVYSSMWKDNGPGAGFSSGLMTPGTTVRMLLGWTTNTLTSDGTGANLSTLGQNLRMVLFFGAVANTATRCSATAWIEAST